MNETATWCPDCGGGGYESHGGQAYMHSINCEGRGLVSTGVPTDQVQLLVDKTMECMKAHDKVDVPARSRRAPWQMQHCCCGWAGYPHADHRSLMLYTMLLREVIADPAGAAVSGEAKKGTW